MNRKRREQIEAAMRRHPSTYHARQQDRREVDLTFVIDPDEDRKWRELVVGVPLDQSDPIDTAQEFHHEPWWLTYSRPRKAKVADVLSAVLLVALMAAMGALEWLIIAGVWPR